MAAVESLNRFRIMASCLLAASRIVERTTYRQIHASLRASPSGSLPSTVQSRRVAICDLRRMRTFSTSTPRSDYHFDTHRYVQRLEKEGLTRPQAEGIMNSMAEVIDESIRTMTREMVTKSAQEKVRSGPRSTRERWARVLTRCTGGVQPASRPWTVEDRAPGM